MSERMSDTACEVCGHGWSEGSHFKCSAARSTPQPARWKCPNCGPRHAHKIAHESHSQIPYCRRCGNDAEAA